MVKVLIEEIGLVMMAKPKRYPFMGVEKKTNQKNCIDAKES